MSDETDLIIIEGPEQSRVDPLLADAGIPPLAGVQNICVFRASKDELTDEKGFTYHHHVDMAGWKGKLYVGWNSCEKDEDVWPSRELYSVSDDGFMWSDPREMFPMGISTALRMYFYHSTSTDRMLIIAGLRTDTSDVEEDRKRGLCVRELKDDHTPGEVFVLREATPWKSPLPLYTTSRDEAFIKACDDLLADTVYLEQQDRGVLLDDRKMKWHDAKNWPGGKVPGDNEKWVAGKAYTFIDRPDGAITGVSKMGWVTVSYDQGKTWSMPAVPKSLVTGKAKVFAIPPKDGVYALAYNPSTRQRYPLVLVTGTDGIHFGNMRLIHGELPIQRYEGKFRSIGPQYTRGLNKRNDDGTRDHKNVAWLVYSMSKEDIWVSRIPLPYQSDAPAVPTWNTYQPRWATIEAIRGGRKITDRDPYDYASAAMVFGPVKRAAVEVSLTINSLPHAAVEVELLDEFGSRCACRLTFGADGKLLLNGSDAGTFSIGQSMNISIAADVQTERCTIAISGRKLAENAPFATKVESLHRVVIRTGFHRNVGGLRPVTKGTDRPTDPIKVRVEQLTIDVT